MTPEDWGPPREERSTSQRMKPQDIDDMLRLAATGSEVERREMADTIIPHFPDANGKIWLRWGFRTSRQSPRNLRPRFLTSKPPQSKRASTRRKPDEITKLLTTALPLFAS